MKNDAYLYGIPEARLKENLESWLENPAWREYYETAPSDLCRMVISLEFWESEYETGAADCAIKNLEGDLSAEDWQHLYRYCGNNPRKKYIHDRIMELKEGTQKSRMTANPLYPCHIYGIEDGKKAFEAIDAERIRDYGKSVTLEDGTVLHMNYPGHHDEGDRYLLRCNICGGLTLVQYSMEECPYWDDPDLYYSDRIPVTSAEEADLLNILWDEEELKRYPFRHLRRDDMNKLWTDGKEPVPYDLKGLKEKIREKYSRMSPGHKEMLEKLINEAGKRTEKNRVLTREEQEAVGNEYNNRGWELQTGDKPDLRGAESWYRKAAKLGNTAAMVNIGNMYEEQGRMREAYEWYMEAAHAGNDAGRFNMARMFFHGKGVNQDYGTAYQYFSELYDKGYPDVCLYMGLYAENGFLEKPDYKAAVRYYEQGIEKGDDYCPVNLGRMYCKGIGVPVDLKKGFELYMLGWERGDALAATNIGYCYEVGQGVRKNRIKAIEYYTRAAEMKEENAIEALKRLEEEGGCSE